MHQNFLRQLVRLCLVYGSVTWALVLAIAGGTALAWEDQAGVDFFEAKIRPVLVQHCYKCHSAQAKTLRGGLRVDSREGMLKGGESGPAVVPKDLSESLLLSSLRHESFEMPPSGKLPDAVIADFARWIEIGAPDPRSTTSSISRPAEIDLEQGRQFWAFRSLQRLPVPSVTDTRWPRTRIDEYLLAKMEQHGLKPHADADRRTLVRRLYFDLIGLPPLPEEIDAAVEHDDPDAIEAIVDRLLDSEHFGERWGRHWLDVARYAESSGGGRTQLFPDAWRYRDYVIRSLNADKPFDRFAAEQIAGDLLPYDSLAERSDQLSALGFLVLGPTNYELQDKELLRMEVVDEQIDTLGRALLGLTLGCARCHDHKFDPIPTEDYYALAGIFRSTKTLTPGNVSGWVKRELPVNSEQQAAIKQHRARVKSIEQKIARVRRRAGIAAAAVEGTNSVDPDTLDGIVIDDDDAQLTGVWRSSRSVKRFVGNTYRVSDDESAKARYSANLPAGHYEVRASHSAHQNRAKRAVFVIRHAGGTTTKKVNQTEVPPLEGGLMVSLGRFRFDGRQPAQVTLVCADVQGVAIADAVQFVAVKDAGGLAEVEPEAADPLLQDKQKALQQINSLQKQLDLLKKDAPPSAPVVMGVQDEDKPADYSVCVRGNVHQLGASVPRGFLQVLPVSGQPTRPKIAPGESGRLQLAEWIVHPDNPLFARVAVNRVWHHLFGVGLVQTPDNFGKMGQPPTHPELLDYLAADFIADGYSIKRLIRRIVLSRAYQMTSQPRADSRRADHDNRWLSRMNRKRLEAEAIHDAMLSASGRLDRSVYGRTMKPGTKNELGYVFNGVRRGVYVPVFRNTMLDLFEAFDVADPNLVTGQRNTSTLPTQALYLMNSPFAVEQARYLAARLSQRKDLDDHGKIAWAYELTLGRPPESQESKLTLQYIDASRRQPLRLPVENSDEIESRWIAACQALFASVDFRYLK